MPASITHELIAREALERLSPSAKEIIYNAPAYYYLGAHGPDLFFFYRPVFGREFNLGRLLHRSRIFDWFTALLTTLPRHTGSDFEQCLAYALGFCTHLAADVAFHPFVYNFLAEIDAPKLTHQEIENDWDVYFLKKHTGQSPQRYRFPFDMREIADAGVLYRYVSEAAVHIGRDLSPSAFRRMCKLFRVYLDHSHTRGARVLSLFGMAELYPREEPDPAYLRGKKFAELTGGKGANADELFSYAVAESAERIDAFLNAFNTDMVLPEELFSRHMLTGKHTE